MQITQLNVITEIPFDFAQKYQTVGLLRPNRRATVYFGTQFIDFRTRRSGKFCLPRIPIINTKGSSAHAGNQEAAGDGSGSSAEHGVDMEEQR